MFLSFITLVHCSPFRARSFAATIRSSGDWSCGTLQQAMWARWLGNFTNLKAHLTLKRGRAPAWDALTALIFKAHRWGQIKPNRRFCHRNTIHAQSTDAVMRLLVDWAMPLSGHTVKICSRDWTLRKCCKRVSGVPVRSDSALHGAVFC